jgi:hypothetical protein
MPKNLFSKQFYLIHIFILGLNFVQAQSPNLQSFGFSKQLNASLPTSIFCNIISDSILQGILPKNQTVSNLVISFNLTDADSLLAGNQKLLSNISTLQDDFNTPLFLYANGALVKQFRLNLVQSNLPILFVNTENLDSIYSKEEYKNAEILLAESATQVSSLPGRIRGRGNSTWFLRKKPYRLKLNNSAAILGMPADKDWNLLANYADKTLLRNALAFQLGSQLNLEYTPRNRFVELVLNGVHQGNYLLTEHIKVGSNRVNINELKQKDTTADKISGGYLLEVDARLDETNTFTSKYGVPIAIKSPEDLDSLHYYYINHYINHFEDTLFSLAFTDSTHGYQKFIDKASFLDWYLLNEILKNNDAILFSSVFLYKKRNGKLFMGPIWDYDIAAGNANINLNDFPQGWWIRNASWFNRLMQDPAFFNETYQRYQQLQQQVLPQLQYFIDSMAVVLDQSQQLNYQIWQTLDSLILFNPQALGSYQAEVNHLKLWLQSRLNWLDANFVRDSLQPFQLVAPQDKQVVLASSLQHNPLSFFWNNNNAGVEYRVYFERPDTTISYNSFSIGSNIWMTDTSLTLNASQLSEIIQHLYPEGTGDTITLHWTVFASAHLIEVPMMAQQVHQLTIIKDHNWADFKLLTPANQLNLELNPQFDQPLLFTWESSESVYYYNWKLSYNPIGAQATPIMDSTVSQANALIFTEQIKKACYDNGIQWQDTMSFSWTVIRGANQSFKASIDTFTFTLIEPPSTNTIVREQTLKTFRVYPNPNNGLLFIHPIKPFKALEIQLLDMNGRVVYQYKTSAQGIQTLEIQDLKDGAYMLYLKEQEGLQIEKIIITN